MMASDDPMVATPTDSATFGAFHRSASIRAQSRSILLAIGYSSWSMWLVRSASWISSSASGSMYVVTKVARFIDGRPSMFRPRWISS